MCSVRHEADALGAELACLRSRPPACRAFARTPSRRTASAHTRIVSKSSLICGGTSGTSPTMTRPVPPSIVIVSPSCSLWPPIVTAFVAASMLRPSQPGDARLAHAARDHRRVRGHAAVRGEDALRLDQPVDVVRGRLPADEDHRLAGLAALLRRVGVEHDLAAGRARRRVQPLRRHLELHASGSSRGCSSWSSCAGSMREIASSRLISPSADHVHGGSGSRPRRCASPSASAGCRASRPRR